MITELVNVTETYGLMYFYGGGQIYQYNTHYVLLVILHVEKISSASIFALYKWFSLLNIKVNQLKRSIVFRIADYVFVDTFHTAIGLNFTLYQPFIVSQLFQNAQSWGINN